MIGNTYKKFALENGLTVSNGVAYGSLRGYAASLFEGGGWKAVVFSVRFSDPARRVELMDLVGNIGDRQLYKTYRVNRLGITDRMIQIQFHDNPGTMKKIAAFLDWFIPLLDAHGASKVNFCAECGLEIQDGDWIMVNGMCHHVHSACGEKIQREIDSDNQRVKEERTGSYLSGTLGAFLGAALGAVLWAVVLYAGYIASLVGLVIGFLSEKGYNLLKGKQGKGKIVILILAVLFGVLAGTLAADVVTLGSMIRAGELPGLDASHIPALMIYMLFGNPEYLRATLSNVGMGLLFAGLGVFALLRRTSKEVADTKFVKLS